MILGCCRDSRQYIKLNKKSQVQTMEERAQAKKIPRQNMQMLVAAFSPRKEA